jgi:DNA excision repair protein ERCC-8
VTSLDRWSDADLFVPSFFNSYQREYAVSCVQWYPYDTGLFISGSMDGQVTVWDTNTFTVAHTFKLNGIAHAARMSPVATTHSLIAST